MGHGHVSNISLTSNSNCWLIEAIVGASSLWLGAAHLSAKKGTEHRSERKSRPVPMILEMILEVKLPSQLSATPLAGSRVFL